MKVSLGISIAHNGSVALICDGKVKIAIQAERISRKKRKHLFLDKEIDLMKKCTQYCLESTGFEYSDIKSIGIATHKNFKKISNSDLFKSIGGFPNEYIETFYVPHHYAHMEYVVHYGNLKPGIVLVLDGSGSAEKDREFFNIIEKHHPKIINHENPSGREVISAYWFDGKKSSLIYRFSSSNLISDEEKESFFHSIGHYWEWASLYCCGSLDEAGKVMGLAAYGKEDKLNNEEMLSISDNGKINFKLKKIKEIYKNPNIFGLDLSSIEHYQNVAHKVQSETEKVILKLLEILKQKHPTDTLYLSGGVALNVVANEKIKNSKIFNNLILNGSVEDNGTAIGAGLTANHEIGVKRNFSVITDYYGRNYKEEKIISSIKEFEFKYEIFFKKEIIKKAAQLIKEQKIFGWFQGRSEFGPRALGNRSILANPTGLSTKHVLDHYMKNRDRYRPYAPVVIEEEASKYFDIDSSSPVMMRNVVVKNKDLIAITHIDGTARVQTVSADDNKILHSLLLEVKKQTGFPILLNTSFNLPGEPIVESPKDALLSFSRGSLDYLFLENVLISR